MTNVESDDSPAPTPRERAKKFAAEMMGRFEGITLGRSTITYDWIYKLYLKKQTKLWKICNGE